MPYISNGRIVDKKRQYSLTNKIKTDKIKSETSKESIKLDFSYLNIVFSYIQFVIRDIKRFKQTQGEYIANDCGELRKHLVFLKLSNMNITQINRNGTRISVTALKRKGIRSIADLVKYDRDFETIDGIGRYSAACINANLTKIINETKKHTGIRLSFDDKNEFSSELVKSISIYLKFLPIYEKTLEYEKKLIAVQPMLLSLKKLLKSPLLLFKPKETLEKAESLYNQIISYYENNFSNFNEEVIDPFNSVKRITAQEAWAHFADDPIEFNKIIEGFSSFATINLAEYGLTDSVAKKVKETTLNLEGFKLGLRSYQEWGTKYILCQRKTILGDEMGLGKTVQAIAAMVDLHNKGTEHFMVICPLSVLTNWCREIIKFSNLRYYRIHGNSKRSIYKRWISDGGVAVTTYETLKSLYIPNDFKIDLLVVDEAHYIKNPEALRTENSLKFINNSERTAFLTGTVLENKVDEMIRLIRYLNPKVADEACDCIDFDDDNYFEYSSDDFKAAISKVYFRRRRSDVLAELPEKTEIDEWCDLNERELEQYRSSVFSRSFMDARRVSFDVESKYSTKMNKIREIVEMAKEDGRKVLVFSFFLDVINKVYNEFRNISYGPITGSVSSETRQKIIDNFDKAPSGSILVSQIQSGGVGLNIQSASVVIICEPQFKPSTENQAISRSYRMGQARKVLVYHLLATDTVDERLNELLMKKQCEFNNYADDSLVAEQSFEIDSAMFTGIMNKEYERLAHNKNLPSENEDSEEQTEVVINEEAKIDEQPSINIPNGKTGVSVTRRISAIKQPRGGYLPINKFQTEILKIDKQLSPDENVSASLIGTAVDYLTRFMNGTSREDSFNISLLGANIVNEGIKAKQLLQKISTDLDDDTIISAIRLCGFDVAFRANPLYYKSVSEIFPDKNTVDNVREMVKRSMNFISKYGPITKDGFTFEGGYTDTISSGDGDFLTEDTLWDFKVIKNEPSSKNTLQLLVYYLMGLHSIHSEYKKIKYLGIYNPRANIVYKYPVSSIPNSIVKEIEQTVIGYK